MKTTFKVTDPDSVKLTLTATMTLREWKLIETAIEEAKYNHTRSEFANRIYSIIQDIEEQFTAEKEEE